MDPDRRIDELGQAEVARHLEAALARLGLNVTQPDLIETPERVAALWGELFAGLDPEGAPEFTVLANADPSAGLVMTRGLRFYSMCAHHLLPFFGRAHLAYLPGLRLAGLGDLTRVVDYFSRRPTLQERIAADVAEYLEKHLEPRGVAVLLEGRHLCMEMRGQKREAIVESSAYRGVLRDPEPRREFLQRLRRR
jgi:GTP cyclohydrolase I